MQRAQRAALGSVAVGIVVFALKSLAYWLTGSVALFSDALESTINIVAAGAAFAALRVAAMPADANHPFGHHKAEYLSAVFEGVLVIVAALMILREAYFGLLDPQPLDAPIRGLLINGVASLINLVWGLVLLRWGRAWRSPSLVADARHVLTDVWTSGGVLAGVFVVALTGWQVLDPALAALVALNILWSGWGMMREATGGLMDAAPSEQEMEKIKAVIGSTAEGAIEAHDVRVRHAGAATFIEFHLIVDGRMNVADAHEICDQVEACLRAQLDGETRISIHIEPDHKAKRQGIVVL